MFDRIKDIIYKIKDYDRLEHDYSTCLCYFTNNRLSKTTYEIRGLETVICDTIGEYHEEGYKHALEVAMEWLNENAKKYFTEPTDMEWFKRDFKKRMEEEL